MMSCIIVALGARYKVNEQSLLCLQDPPPNREG